MGSEGLEPTTPAVSLQVKRNLQSERCPNQARRRALLSVVHAFKWLYGHILDGEMCLLALAL
jgi:hypothetical protein